ncbi:hypothetical protein CJ483_18585 [Bacillus sp. PK3_68]|nr:hypothetical protein CJ483_18585 [Bacillus sp. PK3_68]
MTHPLFHIKQLKDEQVYRPDNVERFFYLYRSILANNRQCNMKNASSWNQGMLSLQASNVNAKEKTSNKQSFQEAENRKSRELESWFKKGIVATLPDKGLIPL